MRRIIAAAVGLLLVAGLTVGPAAPAHAAPDTIDAPTHLPWGGFAYDVCDYVRAGRGYDNWHVDIYEPIFFVHYGGIHVVYCAIRLNGSGSGELSLAYQVLWEWGIVQGWHSCQRYTCW
jgi:hypothetical protein